MFEKITKAAAIAAVCAAVLSSCGKTVPLAGQSESDMEQSAAVTTAATTEPATAPEEETTEYGAPRRIEVDTDMPEGYELKKSCAVYVEAVMQEPEIPTGCEVTALTELVNFYGFDVDKLELCDVFMPIDHEGYYTMNEVYLGDPHLNNGFGCNAPVIVKTADDYFEYIGSDWYAKDLTGISIEEVFYQIEQGRPVVVWSTIGQRETHAEYQFRLGCGEEFYFNPFQHCLTIYGFDYNEGVVHVADPLVGNTKYDMERFARIYEIMGKQAVVLCGNEESAGADYTTDEEKAEWLELNRPKAEDE